MKFNKETLAILKNFGNINSGIVLKQGNFIMTRSVNRTIYAEAVLDDTIDSNLAIYDLSSFLNVMGLVGDDADIEHDIATNTIKITNGKTKIFCSSADESTVVSPKKPVTFPVADVIFELKAEELQQLMRVSRAMAIDTIAISVKDGKIVINGYNQGVDENLERILYSTEVGDWEGTDTFNFMINMSNMKLLMADYKVLVSAKGAVKFETEKFSFVIALELSSTSTF